MGPVSFSLPWLLVLVPSVLFLPKGRYRWLRMLTIALLLVAVAGPSVRVGQDRLVVLMDVSASAGSGAREAAAALEAAAATDGTVWLAMAGDTARILDRDAPLPPGMNLQATDMARALQVAVGFNATRILLVSDGIESTGSALQALPDVPVDTFGIDRVSNARLESLLLPDIAAPGQVVEGLAVISTDEPASMTLRLSTGGTALPPLVRELPPGRSSVPFTFTAGEGGSVQLDALIEVDFEQPLEDDRLSSELPVSEQSPVLVIDDAVTAALLRQAGLEVVEGSPADVQAPLNWSAVVLRGAANAYTTGQHELMRAYVANGGGLMMTGGPESFGFGGWFRTPLEEVLPVTTDLRTEVEIPLVGLVMILDTSQSMSAGNPSRLELAKEGAIAVVEMAYHEDLLGLIAFSDTSEWIFDLRPATERGKREMLAGILGLQTQGGTILGPAYNDAIATLDASDAAVKHIIVLSDGRLYDGQGPFSTTAANFSELASRGRNAGITTSTIAIGANADFEQLSRIAAAGGGRYYEALDVTTLPRIFTSEALVATRSLLREEPLSPEASQHMLSTMTGAQPVISAYIATTARPAAEPILSGFEEEPVLNVIRQGLGRTAALTTDLNAWAPGLASDTDFASTLVRTVRWLQMRPGSYQATVTPTGGRLEVVVDAVEAGEYINNRNLAIRFGGQEEQLVQVAPGRYEGTVDAGTGQGTLLVIDGSEVVARQAVGGVSAEFAASDGPGLLRQISDSTGGVELESLAGYEPEPGTASAPFWQVPLLAALAVFLAELVLRRFGRSRGTGPVRSARRAAVRGGTPRRV